MPYAQVSDVRSLAPHVPITRESQPSEGIVQTWITDVESTLNATLVAFGYPVPLEALPGKTTTAAVVILKDMVTHAVMARIMRSRPNPETDPEAFQKRYDAIIKQLRDPNDPFVLPDIVETGEAVNKESPLRVLSNLADLAMDDTIRIRRDQVF